MTVEVSEAEQPAKESQVTYWFHPESESLWLDDGSKPLNQLGDEALSIELTEAQYARKMVDQIINGHLPLPDGIAAVIKSAAIWPAKSLSGSIYKDRNKRFIDGYMINTTKIVGKEPGGIYITHSGSRYIVDFVQDSYYGVEFNG